MLLDGAFMYKNEAFLIVDRPLAQVFRFLATDLVSTCPKWNKEVVSIKLTDGTNIQRGTKLTLEFTLPGIEREPDTISFAVVGGKIVPSDSVRFVTGMEILEYELDKVLSFKNIFGPSYYGIFTMFFASVEGKTRIELKSSFELPLSAQLISNLLVKNKNPLPEMASDLQKVLEQELE